MQAFSCLFGHKTGISWNSFGDIYRELPYFNTDYEVFDLDTDTSSFFPATDNYNVFYISLSEEKPIENNISVENYRELPLSKKKMKDRF